MYGFNDDEAKQFIENGGKITFVNAPSEPITRERITSTLKNYLELGGEVNMVSVNTGFSGLPHQEAPQRYYNKLIPALFGKKDLIVTEDGKISVDDITFSVTNIKMIDGELTYTNITDLDELRALLIGGSLNYSITSIEFNENYMSKFSKLKNLDDTTQCDNKYIGESMNAILSQIKSASILDYASATFSSTTNCPNLGSTIVNDYMTSSAKCLEKLANDCYTVISIGNAFAGMDDDLSEKSSELNE